MAASAASQPVVKSAPMILTGELGIGFESAING